MTHRTQPAGDAVVVGNIIAALALIVLAALLGGCFFDGLGPTYKSTCNTSACFSTPHTTPSGSLYMLRGDTVRFIACDDYNTVCVPGSDTGNVLASWSVPDSTVVAISHSTPAIRVPSATTVLVRGVAPGH